MSRISRLRNSLTTQQGLEISRTVDQARNLRPIRNSPLTLISILSLPTALTPLTATEPRNRPLETLIATLPKLPSAASVFATLAGPRGVTA